MGGSTKRVFKRAGPIDEDLCDAIGHMRIESLMTILLYRGNPEAQFIEREMGCGGKAVCYVHGEITVKVYDLKKIQRDLISGSFILHSQAACIPPHRQ